MLKVNYHNSKMQTVKTELIYVKWLVRVPKADNITPTISNKCTLAQGNTCINVQIGFCCLMLIK